MVFNLLTTARTQFHTNKQEKYYLFPNEAIIAICRKYQAQKDTAFFPTGRLQL